jgi:hypothetical protein
VLLEVNLAAGMSHRKAVPNYLTWAYTRLPRGYKRDKLSVVLWSSRLESKNIYCSFTREQFLAS